MKRTICMMLFLTVFAVAGSMPAFGAEGGVARKDKTFVNKAVASNTMEVEMGQLAQQKAQSQEVKSFGSRMVAEHGKANDDLKQLAQQKGIEVKAKKKMPMDKSERLEKASGAEFDKKYMKMMVKAHKKDVEEFQKASKEVKDPDIQAFITKTTPIVEQHLQQAQELAKKVGAEM